MVVHSPSNVHTSCMHTQRTQMEVECDKRHKQLAEGQLESEIAHFQQKLQEENLVSHETEEYLKKHTAVSSCTHTCAHARTHEGSVLAVMSVSETNAHHPSLLCVM